MIFNLLVDTEVPKEDYKFELNNYHEIDCQCFSTAFMLKKVFCWMILPYLLYSFLTYLLQKKSWHEQLVWEDKIYIIILKHYLCFNGSHICVKIVFVFPFCYLRRWYKDLFVSQRERYLWCNGNDISPLLFEARDEHLFVSQWDRRLLLSQGIKLNTQSQSPPHTCFTEVKKTTTKIIYQICKISVFDKHFPNRANKIRSTWRRKSGDFGESDE